MIILNDDKPTVLRQAFATLQGIVLYKKKLINTIKDRILAIDYHKYKNTMHSFIPKYIQNLLDIIDK